MISNIFFKFWRVLSMPALVITILILYVTLPDMIAIQHTESGRPNSFLDKQKFFYYSVGIVLVFNFLMNILKNQLLKLNFEKLNPKSLWAKSPQELKQTLEVWFDAFLAIVNSYLVFVLIGVSRINRNEEQRLDINYNWVIIAGIILLLILVFYLPVRLLFTNPKSEE